ncbi:MAG TPA: flagellar assembly protein FliH [Telluria sp.]|nr:flagellar assembly protein FliH [Telluria sp.]
MSISKETMTAYQRWEMNSFGDERPSVVAAQQRNAAPVVEMPTEAQVAAVFAEARKAGMEEGRADGYNKGLAIGRAEAAQELKHLKSIAAEFGDAVARADETIAQDMLDLALHLARQMLRTALDVKPELVLPVVREAIEYLPIVQQPALLVLNPQDAQLVREGLRDELEGAGWRVVEDPTMGRGGCKIDTPHNQIDALAASRWNRLAHALGQNVEWLG